MGTWEQFVQLDERPQAERFIAVMADVVSEVGDGFTSRRRPIIDDYITECRYVYEGQPDCLIGRILARLGLPLDVLSAFEGRGASLVMGHLGIKSLSRHLADRAQGHQDRGNPWVAVLGATRHLLDQAALPHS